MLDSAGGGGMGMMVGLRQAATDGSFAVNDTGGQALLTAIREMAKWVDDSLADLDTLAQQPALGSSNGATLMKPYVQDVAMDQDGFLTMLKEFRASLVDAEAGVIGAMNNYKNIDGGIEGNFRA
jgi:hypothetical protein